MNKQSIEPRPIGATAIAVVFAIGATFYLLLGLWLGFFNVPADTVSTSSLKPLPDWVALTNGLLSLTLGLLYLILLRMVLGRTNSAYPMVQAVAAINIAFGLFRLPAGIISIIISVLILMMSNSTPTKAWLKNDNS